MRTSFSEYSKLYLNPPSINKIFDVACIGYFGQRIVLFRCRESDYSVQVFCHHPGSSVSA